MACFPNGTSGAIYEDTYCRRCAHFGPEDGPGCPVWGAHLLYSSEQHKDERIATILELLIPSADNGDAKQCAMFVEDAPKDGYQLALRKLTRIELAAL